VAAVDIWRLATDTYRLNFPEATVYTLTAKSLSPKQVQKDVGKIDLILASPECTNHSVAKGNRPICEKSRETAFELVGFAENLLPRWIVVENVLQMKRWHRFNEWHQQIKDIGYKTKIAILDAQYYGIPQSRRRLFVIGDLEATPILPKPGRCTQKTVTSILGRGECFEGIQRVLAPALCLFIKQ